MKYITYWKKRILLFLYKKKIFVSLILLLFASYPLSALASEAVVKSNFTAPFLWSWSGAWIFAFAGACSSLFIKIDEIDENLRWIYFAKPFMGTFSAIAVGMFLVEDVTNPGPTLVFYSYFVGFCCSPILQGLMIKLSNEDVFNRIFNFFIKTKGK
jgi:hypothetical protein